MAAKITPTMAAIRLASSMRMIIAGIEAMLHFTRIITIRQNGTSISRMVTKLPISSVMVFAPSGSAVGASQPRMVPL